MKISDIRYAYIVGAGFSRYAGLPLQSDFTEQLLAARRSDDPASKALVKHLSEFIHFAFDHSRKAEARYWPALEDIFTCIDLSANSGHHLGNQYSPSHLRTMRRALLTRIIEMLYERYEQTKGEPTSDWRKLNRFWKAVNLSSSAFICLNWDTVIEHCLADVHQEFNFDYRCSAAHAQFQEEDEGVRVVNSRYLDSPTVVKMHGSVNWLYCDNCRQLYWFSPSDIPRIARQLLSPEEWASMDCKCPYTAQWRCARCPQVPLTTRLATFSYLKALDYSMFQRSWLSAEAILRQAQKWVFIGYSLPAADYEFKYLLKRIQLSRQDKPEFVLITGGPSPETTYRNYQKFFGRGIRSGTNYFGNGLSNEAIESAIS